jgi:N,N'-diacetyllegionaminate synthase
MSTKVTIIAEAGVNHNGDMNIARKLVDVAAEAGADYVKFQTFKADKLVSKDAKKAAYQQRNIGDNDDSQFAMLKALEVTEADHYMLKEYASSRSIKFLSTGFDLQSIEFLNKLGMDFFKVPSGELTNYSYLKKIASFRLPVVLSTGMANLQEVRDAVEVMTGNGVPLSSISVLHCNTEYPTPLEDVNLKAMVTMGNTFNVRYGYSDHTLGITIPIAAVALGGTVIEKHFTLDRTLPGPDHKASLEPHELKEMVKAIRDIERSLGDGVKKPSVSEEKNRDIARKSLYLATSVRAGEVFEEHHFIALRPGDGISPMQIPSIVGRKSAIALSEGTKLNKDHIQ